MLETNVSVVVGGQFGSEAKGAVTAHLARTSDRRPVVVRVAGPNAGHTAYDPQGRPWALRQVPVGMVTRPDAIGVIADGSEIDLPVLVDEIQRLEAAGHQIFGRLVVSADATLLSDADHDTETERDMHAQLGSTGKGIGAARAARALRTALTPRLLAHPEPQQNCAFFGKSLGPQLHELYHRSGPDVASMVNRLRFYAGVPELLRVYLENDYHVIIEGTQGYGLGLHQPYYPRVTSSDTRAIDFLAMAGISPWDPEVDGLDVWVVVRAFPIRVAGNSGPLANETSWEELGLPVELTTVTKKPRRVGLWDPNLYSDAIAGNGHNVKVAYTMADREYPVLAGLAGAVNGWDADSLPEENGEAEAIRKIAARVGGNRLHYIGTGPNSALFLNQRHG